MSRQSKRTWKNINDLAKKSTVLYQQKDTDSVISQCHSNRSFCFNKVNFSRNKRDSSLKRDDLGSSHQFGIASRVKQKDHSHNNSVVSGDHIINRSITKHSKKKDLSIGELFDGDSVLIKRISSSPKAKKTSKNLMKYVSSARGIQEQLKYLADNMLLEFEKIKEDMQANLLKLIEMVLSTTASGESVPAFSPKNSLKNSNFQNSKTNKNLQQQTTSKLQTIKESLIEGFKLIKKTIDVLPESLTLIQSKYEVEGDDKFDSQQIKPKMSPNRQLHLIGRNDPQTPHNYNEADQKDLDYNSRLRSRTHKQKYTPQAEPLNSSKEYNNRVTHKNSAILKRSSFQRPLQSNHEYHEMSNEHRQSSKEGQSNQAYKSPSSSRTSEFVNGQMKRSITDRYNEKGKERPFRAARQSQLQFKNAENRALVRTHHDSEVEQDSTLNVPQMSNMDIIISKMREMLNQDVSSQS